MQIVSNPPAPSNGRPIYGFWANSIGGPAGRLARLLIKAIEVETTPGPTNTHTHKSEFAIYATTKCTLGNKHISKVEQDLILGAPKMCRYPPTTIYRYLNLPSAQRIQTYNSHRHRSTSLLRTHSSPTQPTTLQPKTQTHVQHSPCSHIIGKTQTDSSHPLTISQPTPSEPNTYTSHILHQLFSSHAPHSSITHQLR